MMQSMNKFIQGWLAYVIVGVIVVCFSFWGVENYLMGNSSENLLAKVGHQEIKEEAFRDAFLAEQQHLQQQLGSVQLTAAQTAALKSDVLDQMITNAAIFQFLQKEGFGISKFESDKLIANDPDFQVNGAFSLNRFKQIAMAQQNSVNVLVQQINANIVQNQLVSGLQGSVFVLPDEVKEAYQLQNQTRDIQTATLSATALAANQHPTQQAIQQYYQDHVADFMKSAQVKVNYIVLSEADLKKSITVSNADAKQYYQSNNANYLKNNKLIPFEEVRSDIVNTLKQQRAEAKYANLRNQLSDKLYADSNNLASAAELIGGSIQTSDWIVKGAKATGIFADPSVQKIVFSADVIQNKLNSEPIELSNKTIVAVHLNAYQAPAPKSLNAVKNDVTMRLQRQMASELLAEQANDLMNSLKQNQQPVQLPAWTTQNKIKLSDKNVAPEVIQAAFQLTTKSPATQYKAVALKNGDYVIVKLLAIHEPNFEIATAKEKNDLSTALTQMKQQTAMQLFAKAIVAETKVKKYGFPKEE